MRLNGMIETQKYKALVFLKGKLNVNYLKMCYPYWESEKSGVNKAS